MPRPRLLARFGELAVEGAGLLVAVPLWVWWAVWKGGYPPAVFLVAIGYLALAAVALQLFAPRPRLGRASGWALGTLAALSAWTLASLLWADDRGAAEVARTRQILLLGSFALPVLWPPTARALVAGIAAVPLVALCGAVSALGGALADVGTLVDGRLAGPTGYANASAALMAAGILPALVLGSRRELAIPLRALSLAAAGALLGTFMLTQSRGGLGALALVLLLASLVRAGTSAAPDPGCPGRDCGRCGPRPAAGGALRRGGRRRRGGSAARRHRRAADEHRRAGRGRRDIRRGRLPDRGRSEDGAPCLGGGRNRVRLHCPGRRGRAGRLRA